LKESFSKQVDILPAGIGFAQKGKGVGGVSDADIAPHRDRLCRRLRNRGQRPLPQSFCAKPASMYTDVPSTTSLVRETEGLAMASVYRSAPAGTTDGPHAEPPRLLDRLRFAHSRRTVLCQWRGPFPSCPRRRADDSLIGSRITDRL